MSSPHTNEDHFDTELRDRLAALGRRPVDTSKLREQLEARVAVESSSPRQPRRFLPSWRPLLAAAAAVLLLVATSLMLTTGSSVAVASPTQLAGLYRQVVAQSPTNRTVHSILAANRLIAGEAAHTPSLPHQVTGHVSSCCLLRLHGKPIAAVHLKCRGHSVSLMVAYSNAVTFPMGRIVRHAGHRFVVSKDDGLNMVMTHHDKRWLCVASDLSRQQLLDLAAAIRF